MAPCRRGSLRIGHRGGAFEHHPPSVSSGSATPRRNRHGTDRTSGRDPAGSGSKLGKPVVASLCPPRFLDGAVGRPGRRRHLPRLLHLYAADGADAVLAVAAGDIATAAASRSDIAIGCADIATAAARCSAISTGGAEATTLCDTACTVQRIRDCNPRSQRDAARRIGACGRARRSAGPPGGRPPCPSSWPTSASRTP